MDAIAPKSLWEPKTAILRKKILQRAMRAVYKHLKGCVVKGTAYPFCMSQKEGINPIHKNFKKRPCWPTGYRTFFLTLKEIWSRNLIIQDKTSVPSLEAFKYCPIDVGNFRKGWEVEMTSQSFQLLNGSVIQI